jgi:hypothetical protein
VPNTPKPNRTDQTAADQKLIDGLNKHASAITALVIAGVTMSPKDIIAVLQSRIATSTNANLTRAAFRAAASADQDERGKTKAFASRLRQALLVVFAGQVDTLADFGLTPRKVAVRTPEQKLAAAVKAKATRQARHTMGKVQKSKITGANPTGAPVGLPAPAAPAAGPTPAPIAPAAIAPVNAGPSPAPAPVVAPAAPVAPVPVAAPAAAPTQNPKS